MNIVIHIHNIDHHLTKHIVRYIYVSFDPLHRYQWPPLHMSCFTLLHVGHPCTRIYWPPLHLIIPFIGQHSTRSSLSLTGTSHGHSSHWAHQYIVMAIIGGDYHYMIMLPPLHIVIPIIGNLHISIIEFACTYNYNWLLAHGHSHHWLSLHMAIPIIGHPYTWSSSSLAISTHGHPNHWPPLHIVISIIPLHMVNPIIGPPYTWSYWSLTISH